MVSATALDSAQVAKKATMTIVRYLTAIAGDNPNEPHLIPLRDPG